MRKKIVSILVIACLIITTKVYAVNDSFETTLKVNNSQVKAEESITITMGLNNIAIESGEKGIGAYTGRIKFDASVLEYVSTNGTDKWDAPLYENGLITATTKDGKVVNTQQNIGTITFKVKKDAKLGDTTIALENFSGTTGGMEGKDVTTGDKSVKVTIASNSNKDDTNKDDTNKGDNNNNGNNSGNQPSGNTGNKVQNTSGSKDKTTSANAANTKKGVLPKAGSENIIVFIAIGGILLLILLYARVKIVDKKMKK